MHDTVGAAHGQSAEQSTTDNVTIKASDIFPKNLIGFSQSLAEFKAFLKEFKTAKIVLSLNVKMQMVSIAKRLAEWVDTCETAYNSLVTALSEDGQTVKFGSENFRTLEEEYAKLLEGSIEIPLSEKIVLPASAAPAVATFSLGELEFLDKYIFDFSQALAAAEKKKENRQ